MTLAPIEQARPDIRVKRASVVPLHVHEREGVVLVEGDRTLPFPLKRSYFITGLREADARGGHAHRESHQVIVCAQGAFDLLLDDGEQKQTIRLADPRVGIHMEPGLWATMSNFSDDCVIVVFADRANDEADYIRSYDVFQMFAHELPA